jgi:hypothetical protein
VTPAGVFALLLLLFYIACFWLAAGGARLGSEGGRTWAVVLTAVPVAASMLWVLFSWFAWAFQCDDSCGLPADDWHHRAGAWQWSGLLALALGGLAFSAIALTLALRDSYAGAAVALVVAGACAAAWVSL